MRFPVLLGLGVVAAAILARRDRSRELRGAVVAITGGSRGLGLAIAQELARQGCRLSICARDPETLEAARVRLATSGADVFAMPCDVGDREAVDRFIGATQERFGRIDVLVNNAGVITVGPLDALGIETFEEAMRTMFWGPLYATLAVLPGMRARRSGTIVNISSLGGKVAPPHLLPYSAAKFATTGLSEGLHMELARDGVSVLTVAPGLMRTGSHFAARFAGDPKSEFAIFSVLANLPVSSISAPAAARQVVAAIRAGEAELIISPQARIAALVQGAMPGVTARVIGFAARALPEAPPPERRSVALGRDSESAVSSSFLTALGRRAARAWQPASLHPADARHGEGEAP